MELSQALLDGPSDAQREILLCLIRKGTATSIDLRQAARLSPSGINHHLAIMVAQGLVVRHTARVFPSGRGRPAFQYAVTAKGQALFPAKGHDLALNVLRRLADREPEIVDDVIREALSPLVEEGRRRLAGLRSLSARLEEWQRLFEERGFVTNITATVRNAGGIEQAHCPFSAIAGVCPQVCAIESRLLGWAFEEYEVRKVDGRSLGSRTCRWSLRKARPRRSVDPGAGSVVPLSA
jgi:predicted ArsR family transcriptional regulator